MESATIAPLKNVGLCSRGLERAMNRQAHLPGIVVLYGPAGYGKSFAAAYTANKHRAHYVECRSTWTQKAVLSAIAREMDLVPASTTYALTDQISEHLALSERPLIIDEVDHIVKRQAVEIIRDIYEGSQAAILVIGEERLPEHLRKWERFHGRVLDFIAAQPADLDDARTLARFYCRKVKIADDLLAQVTKVAKGSIRRVCVNLAQIEEGAVSSGLKEISASQWTKGFFTGDVPVRNL